VTRDVGTVLLRHYFVSRVSRTPPGDGHLLRSLVDDHIVGSQSEVRIGERNRYIVRVGREPARSIVH
jgi:hypothetical protein